MWRLRIKGGGGDRAFERGKRDAEFFLYMHWKMLLYVFIFISSIACHDFTIIYFKGACVMIFS